MPRDEGTTRPRAPMSGIHTVFTNSDRCKHPHASRRVPRPHLPANLFKPSALASLPHERNREGSMRKTFSRPQYRKDTTPEQRTRVCLITAVELMSSSTRYPLVSSCHRRGDQHQHRLSPNGHHLGQPVAAPTPASGKTASWDPARSAVDEDTRWK